ncbi:MAG: hypothetical protein ABUS56_02810 [Acidobacteriota bacterium]
MTPPGRRVCGAVVLALAGLTTPAWGQTPGGPFAGLFGAGARTTQGQTLDLRGALFGTYQQVNVPDDQAANIDPRFQKSAAIGGTTGTLTYGYRRMTNNGPGASSSFVVNGNGSIADYSVNPDLPTYSFGLGVGLSKATRTTSLNSTVGGSYSSTYIAPFQGGIGQFDAGTNIAATGGGGTTATTPQPLYSIGPNLPTYGATAGTTLITTLTRKITFNASGSAGYASTYSFASFQPVNTFDAAAPTTTGGALAATTEPIITLRGSTGLTDRLTRTSTLSIQGDWTDSRLVNGGPGDLRTLGARAIYSQQVTRDLGFHAGYGRYVTDYSNAPSTTSENIDVGVDYNRGGTFALGRRTTVSFATSTSFVTIRDRVTGNSDTRFRVNGNAGINRRLGRTWVASGAYTRALGFLAGFTDPILSDAVTGSIGGQVTSRASWNSSAGWTRNQVGFNNDQIFGGYSAITIFNVGLFRNLGMYAQYAYFGYRLPPDAAAANILSTFSRQAASVGLNLWVPIINGRSRS